MMKVPTLTLTKVYYLKQQGILIADMDLMIASIAIANDFSLVTNNLRHFDKIENLKIERWL